MSANQGILVPDNTSALQTQPSPAVNLSAMFERLALADIDVNKLQALMDMQRQILADQSRAEFNAAMSECQKQMRPIAADANNPQTKSRYASYKALDSALRPIYTDCGFGLSFNTADGAAADWVRVTCLVSHAGGHERTYHVDMPADGKGAKGGDVMTKTHAVGAAMSYGMRYLLKMIFNVAVGEDDRDGNDPPVRERVPAPKGFDDWLVDLETVAGEGLEALQRAWRESRTDHKEYLTKSDPGRWNALKLRAGKVTGASR